MRSHKVEVDDDIFQYVKAHAEPLVDTFNTALRRLLLGGSAKPDKPKITIKHSGNGDILPSLPSQTPQALRHILEVAYLVRGGAYDRPAATQFVAKHHNVFPQTVLDKYCRQLNLTAREFDQLLSKSELWDLKRILTSKFPDFSELIEEILG